eukprot:GGOE01061778.1.p1 GENE.GGOE01061778.1~~GGOE01061778.1.p1  ORF type:complete len:378 (-),score=59.60 GGOE01061778.1:284-1417(-)
MKGLHLILVVLHALAWSPSCEVSLSDLLSLNGTSPTNATALVVVLHNPWDTIFGVHNWTAAPSNVLGIPSFGPLKMGTTVSPEGAESLAVDVPGNVSYDTTAWEVRIVLEGVAVLVANASQSTLSNTTWKLKARVSSVSTVGGVPGSNPLSGPLPVNWQNNMEAPEPSPPSSQSAGRWWIQWVMSGDVDAFTEPQQYQFRRFIASFLSRPSWAITLIRIQAGSIVVTFRLDGYSEEADERAAIDLLRSSCKRAAPGYGIKCETLLVSPAGEDSIYTEAGGGITVGIIAAIVGCLLALGLCLGCAFVLLRRQKRTVGDEDDICQTLFTQETLVEGAPIETVELRAECDVDSAPAHVRAPTHEALPAPAEGSSSSSSNG